MISSLLLCDDHALVREAIAGAILGKWPSLDLLEAGDFPSAWTLAADGVDMCICDLTMPGAEPLDGVQRLKQSAPDMPILILTGGQDDALMVKLLALGVNGFALKDSGSAVLLAAIEVIIAGERYIPSRILALMGTGPMAAETVHLTDQQRRVVALVARGFSNKAIAHELGVAPSTIKSHLEHAMRATEATSRFEAASRARAAGLI